MNLILLTDGNLSMMKASSGDVWVENAKTGAQSLALHHTEVAQILAGEVDLADVELTDAACDDCGRVDATVRHVESATHCANVCTACVPR